MALESTLRAFRAVKVPPGWRVEMIVSDNGSVDHTAGVVKSASHPEIEIHYIHEPVPGKSRAQNAALAQARGDALLFTDDDVEPAENWIEAMAQPLLERRCDAVAGRITLADEIRRPWFDPMHALWLAEVRELAEKSPELVGASMGIHRSVFDQIDGFNEDLGPGITGFGEETLLWQQMIEAGMPIQPVRNTCVIHHPDPSRLTRSSWLAGAVQRGRTHAFITHHWEHGKVGFPRLKRFWIQAKLFLRRRVCPPGPPESEGCPAWEMSYLTQAERLRWLIEEARKPRKYDIRALRRRDSQ